MTEEQDYVAYRAVVDGVITDLKEIEKERFIRILDKTGAMSGQAKAFIEGLLNNGCDVDTILAAMAEAAGERKEDEG